MRVFNEDKTCELNYKNLDLEKGYLKPDKLVTAHHEATSFVKGKTAQEIANELTTQGKTIEIGYDGLPYLVVEEHEGGGRSVEEIKAEPDVPAKDAYDDYEDIQVYVPYTEAELTEHNERKELASLEKWFTEVYDTQVKQYNRCQRLGVEYDNKYGTIAELDKQATVNAKRISELRKKYSTK